MWQRLSSRWANLRIFYKLTLGFAALVVLLLVEIVISTLVETVENRANEDLIRASSDALLAEQLKSASLQIHVYQSEALLAYLARGPNDSLATYALVSPIVDTGLALVEQIKPRAGDEQRQALVAEIETNMRAYQTEIVNGLIPQIELRGTEDSGLMGDVVVRINRVQDLMEAEGYVEYSAAAEKLKQDVINFLPDPVAAISQIQDIGNQVNNLVAAIEASEMPADSQQRMITEIRSAGGSIDLFLRNDLIQIGLRSVNVRSITASITEATTEYVSLMSAIKQQAQEDHESAEEFSQRVQITITLLVILGALLVALLISRDITRRVKMLDDVSHAIALGDYDRRTRDPAHDELGRLAHSIDKMTAVIQAREAELRMATDKANEATRVKSEFLASVSHELRTPLNAIIGFSDMLLMGMSGPLNEKQLHQITRLKENGSRLLNLVNDVLDLSRLEARRVEILPRPFAPRTLIRQLDAQLAVLAEKKALDFETIIDPALPETLIGDEKRIEQVVVNLISNAVKFTERGSICLEARLLPTDHSWVIAVSDTGIGIPPHALDLIFEQFRQVDGSSTRTYQGSGLGLAITRHLVHLMGGQIKVESELGRGSKFSIVLPVVEEAQRVNE